MRKIIYLFLTLLFILLITSCSINHNVYYSEDGLIYKGNSYCYCESIFTTDFFNLKEIGKINQLQRYYFYSYAFDNPEIIVPKNGNHSYIRKDVDYKDYCFNFIAPKDEAYNQESVNYSFTLNDILGEEVVKIDHKYEQVDIIIGVAYEPMTLLVEIKLYADKNNYYIYLEDKLYNISDQFNIFLNVYYNGL